MGGWDVQYVLDGLGWADGMCSVFWMGLDGRMGWAVFFEWEKSEKVHIVIIYCFYTDHVFLVPNNIMVALKCLCYFMCVYKIIIVYERKGYKIFCINVQSIYILYIT